MGQPVPINALRGVGGLTMDMGRSMDRSDELLSSGAGQIQMLLNPQVSHQGESGHLDTLGEQQASASPQQRGAC